MSRCPDGQIYSPPELPPYLKEAYNLKPVVGVPNDQELVEIYAVIRIVHKTVDIPGMGSTSLLSHLSEHLFNVQMAKYHSKYIDIVFPENTIYTPPALPTHLSTQLEPISGVPSSEEIVKVQDAIRAYQQFANASSDFDPIVNMELSQHLFDIQMASYTHRARQSHSDSVSRGINSTSSRSIQQTDDVTEQRKVAVNDVGAEPSGGLVQPIKRVLDMDVRDTNRIAEQASQLAERTNLLIERSNQIAERANQLAERSNQPIEQSDSLVENFVELFGKLNGHLEQSNRLSELATKPVEKVEEVLRDICRVLARIQHAIVRSHKGNAARAADCLTNEKGYTPGGSESYFGDFNSLSIQFTGKTGCHLPVTINGVSHDLSLDDPWVGNFLRFYGIGEFYFDSKISNILRAKDAAGARVVLSRYLSSCLG
ncbi:unnamed protein product [Rhizoctonia solani]|uniref:Laminin domain protein n=1 Tax=Rhizoctonia solani TaxID=456999 RepID=A0A8H2WQF7_9AGAM|nr:unnamed protein product [Rhizoctonia solani]